MNDKVKNAVIQQMSISYVATEDRLLLRIGVSNQSELSVWLTRRVAKKIAQLLHDTPISITPDPRVNTPYTQNLEQRFAKEELLQKLNFSDSYEERQSLNQGKIFLVNDCRLLQPNDHQSVLEFICLNQQTVSVTLNDEFLMGLTNMLQLAGQQAAWDFAFTEQTLLPDLSHTTTLLH
jgi:superfamily I DNA and RNA helicase